MGEKGVSGVPKVGRSATLSNPLQPQPIEVESFLNDEFFSVERRVYFLRAALLRSLACSLADPMGCGMTKSPVDRGVPSGWV